MVVQMDGSMAQQQAALLVVDWDKMLGALNDCCDGYTDSRPTGRLDGHEEGCAFG